MYRRSLACMAKHKQASSSSSTGGRTIVRDPRKARAAAAALKTREQPGSSPAPPPPPPRRPLPFEPSRENQRSVGSTLAAWAIAGMAVSLGAGLVRFFIG